MSQILKHYRHFLSSLYFLVYLAGFFFIEYYITDDYTVIHCSLDDKIPFVEYFIIPYLLWFLFFVAVLLYLGLTNKREYYQYFFLLAIGMTLFVVVSILFPNGQNLRPDIDPDKNIFTALVASIYRSDTPFLLAIGMTLFVVVSILFPNGQNLRPDIDPDKNIFTALVASIYRSDTPTNIFPSIHVYNAVAAQYAIMHNKKLSRSIKLGGLVLTIMICLATVFLKQHSVIDGIGGIIMAIVFVYILYYFKPVVRIFEKIPAYLYHPAKENTTSLSSDFIKES